MRSVIAAVLFVLAGGAGAANYTCPPPLSIAQVACTFGSTGGTTTYTATVSGQVAGSAQAKSGIALFMTVNGSACNNNYGVSIPITCQAISVTATESCTFDVTSGELVQFAAYYEGQNASGAFISLSATIDRYVPDFVLNVARAGSGTVVSKDGRINCGFDCFDSYAPGTLVTLTANPAEGWVFNGWTGACSGSPKTCTVAMSETRSVTASFLFEDWPPVVEFHNTLLDHYFITVDAVEAGAVDAGGAGPGWSRTGLSFKSNGNVPVCRFYGSPAIGPNSHFYTADPLECNFLKQLAAVTPNSQPRWNFEGLAFTTTSPVGGNCGAGTVPVHRAYNDGYALGKDSNHRLTTSQAAIQELTSRGWKYEGVAMCAPQ